MIEEKIILSNWLTDRFDVDAKARNQNVESLFFEMIAKKEHLNLIDAGSGTGGNLVYLLPKIKCNQTWYLVEQDAILIKACQQRLSKMFKMTILSENEMLFKSGVYIINLKWFHTDITEFIKNPSYQNNFDILTASALFDVLPKDTFQKIADFARKKQLILFGTLNYETTIVKNTTKMDSHYTNMYQQHMKLPQAYGIKMGGDCKTDILSLLNENEKQNLAIGESNWQLNQMHSDMLKQLIQFFAESIPDLLKSKEEHKAFSNWINLKKEQINNQQLSVIVEHFDFLLDFSN